MQTHFPSSFSVGWIAFSMKALEPGRTNPRILSNVRKGSLSTQAAALTSSVCISLIQIQTGATWARLSVSGRADVENDLKGNRRCCRMNSEKLQLIKPQRKLILKTFQHLKRRFRSVIYLGLLYWQETGLLRWSGAAVMSCLTLLHCREINPAHYVHTLQCHRWRRHFWKWKWMASGCDMASFLFI